MQNNNELFFQYVGSFAFLEIQILVVISECGILSYTSVRTLHYVKAFVKHHVKTFIDMKKVARTVFE